MWAKRPMVRSRRRSFMMNRGDAAQACLMYSHHLQTTKNSLQKWSWHPHAGDPDKKDYLRSVAPTYLTAKWWPVFKMNLSWHFYPESETVFDISHHGTHLNKTQCQDEVRILSGRTQKLKVAKQCWKQLNEHNLMYIYHKQCENMQKIQWKSSNGQIQCF